MAALLRNKAPSRIPSPLLLSVIALAFLTVFLLYKVDNLAFQTKTVAGHNLPPTPWHLFPPRTFHDQSRHARAFQILHCSYLTCPYSNTSLSKGSSPFKSSQSRHRCPQLFMFIHHDLEPWARSGITKDHIMGAKNYASFRVVIYEGRLFLDPYYACVQSRMMFTVWGLLQLLKRYPGMVPDVDIMFDCMDKPSINKTEHGSFPLPLFRYCTTQDHFDIPFPDWSFWGWPEVNIRPWDEEFQDIKRGSEARSWHRKWPRAYWKGNPDVGSPIRNELQECNNTGEWGALIMRQDWVEEAKKGYESSKLSNQCDYQYKIYAEGFAWSVSLKYIISCGSLALIISPQYEDFFSRGLIPKENYWPVSPDNGLCQSIKFAVDWGNRNPSEAQKTGKAGRDLMQSLNMDRVYDYMFHLITEYSKLQDFKPVPPSSALEVCVDSLTCFADEKQKHFLERATASPSPNPPCTLQPANSDLIQNWMQQKQRTITSVREMELSA